MDQESFESSIRSKMESGGIKPPNSIWTRIAGSLNDNAIISLQSAYHRYKWTAVAAILLAVLSFALNLDFEQAQAEPSNSTSFNALLPPSSGHFRFYDNVQPFEQSRNENAWSNIIFLERESNTIEKGNSVLLADNGGYLQAFDEVSGIEKLSPGVEEADVTESSVSAYYVPQLRSTKKSSDGPRRTYWAGLEAGAGNFNPTFSGANPIVADVNFDALASNLGQSGFVNPTSTATQNGMNEGIATSLGLDFGVKMGKRWAIESGIQYTNIQSQANASLNIVDVYVINASEVAGSEIDEPGGSNQRARIEESFDHAINLDNNIKFTSIPLKAGYYLMNERLSLKLNAGLSANYFLSSRLTDPTGQLEAADQSGAYNEWSFDGLTGFEFGYSVSDNFNLTLEPNYRRSITPISENLNTGSGFMIQTGLRYTIK